MRDWIDRNQLSLIRKNIYRATVKDLLYAFSIDNMEAVFLIMTNLTIRQQLANKCQNLSQGEREFLLQVDPRDIAQIIKKLTTD